MSGHQESTPYRLFADRAVGSPDEMAVEARDGAASYAELAALAEGLAGRLGETRVLGVAARGGLAASVALLASLRAGTTAVLLAPPAPGRDTPLVPDTPVDLVLTDPGDEVPGVWPGTARLSALADAPGGAVTARRDVRVGPALLVPAGPGEPWVPVGHDALTSGVARRCEEGAREPTAPAHPWREPTLRDAVVAMLAAWARGGTVVVGGPATRDAGPPEPLDPDTARRALTGLFRQVLADPAVGPDDDFFERGGHSLLALDLAFRVYEEYGLELSANDVFEHPTARRLADRMASGLLSAGAEYDALVDEIASLSDDEVRRFLHES
ncbi:non-ribosomal peptide synthetase [Streptomyces triticirhizae]|uniref:Carrier domain-containing protein n=1 Tax=Streptomyces triticirhizae TaxID=2483353 RepID=A0A3M2L9A6_9ACTN|nr:non-ribosomal peptide synthetase [Streptomyces triticirhizae]RMI32505.1 hypothetical protein EBN88_25030 [Streptomyces triticirhizae]